MIRLTVEEMNLLSIYHEGSKAQLMENMTAARTLYLTGRRGGMCLPAAYFLFTSMQVVSDCRTSS